VAGTEIDYKLAISVPVNFRLQRLVRVARSGSGDKTLERVTPLNWGVRIARKGEARCAQCERLESPVCVERQWNTHPSEFNCSAI